MPVPAGGDPDVVGIFDVDELRVKLQLATIDEAAGELAREAAEGWLEDATGLSVWPDPVPKRLKHWALELAAIVYNNPTLATQESVDDYRVSYQDRERMNAILDRARSAYSTTGGPQYSFPEADWSWTTVSTSSATG
jgi:hypothetical protein